MGSKSSCFFGMQLLASWRFKWLDVDLGQNSDSNFEEDDLSLTNYSEEKTKWNSCFGNYVLEHLNLVVMLM
jgi:hypothetical protein